VEKYGGWAPVVGLGLGALISKEMVLINANHLFVAHFSIIMTMGYLFGIDAFDDMRREEYWNRKNQVDSHFDLAIKALNVHKNVLQAGAKTHTALVDLLEKDNRSWEIERRYREYQQRAQAREDTISALEKLETREAALAKKLAAEASAAEANLVVETLNSLTKEEITAYTDLAIDLLDFPSAPRWCEPFNKKLETARSK
jgi:hypothetical protein